MSCFKEENESDEGLSGALLRVIEDENKVEWLREILSGFSHRCRNSLNGMKLGFYLCRRESKGPVPPVWAELEHTYELIERTIDRLQIIYRPMVLTLVESKLGPMIAEREAAWRLSFAERGKALLIDKPPSEPPGHFDPMLLGQGLDAFISWRSDVCPPGTKARISWKCHNLRFQLDWREEIPSTTQAESELTRRSEGPIEGLRRQIDPLALPLLARIILAHSGRLLHSPGYDRSLALRLTWPLAQANPTQVSRHYGVEFNLPSPIEDVRRESASVD